MMLTSGNLDEVRDELEIAAVFARSYDFSAAVMRARDAVRIAWDADARDEAVLVLRELEAKERAWRADAEALERRYDVEELAAAEVDDERTTPRLAPRRRWSTTKRLLSRLRQEERRALV